MTALEKGVDLVSRAIGDQGSVGPAVQILRNWQHRLDKLTVLDGVGRNEVQEDLRLLAELLQEIHHGDPKFRSVRESDVRGRIDAVRSKLMALVGVHGMD